jgi:membrane-bound metal-dependent hydrolase YbcI (DUF457 family)
LFIGHYALALAAKRVAPRTSLGTLFVAPTLADLLWPVFLLLGWEQARVVPGANPFLVLWLDDFPVSHSLVTLIAWGALFGWLYRMRTGYARGALVVGLLVVSHWVLDVVTHRPDTPLYPGSVEVGLGLWNSVAGTLLVEGLMFVGGVWVYFAATRPRDNIGRWGFWALVAVLAASYASSLFAPPPQDVTALAIAAIVFGWLFVLFGMWVDRHRELREVV